MAPPVPGPLEGLNAAVAAQIRAEAAAAKLTDKALAKKADVNYASLRRWLGKDIGNVRHIDVAVLGALADALGLSAAEIVRRAVERSENEAATVSPLPTRSTPDSSPSSFEDADLAARNEDREKPRMD